MYTFPSFYEILTDRPTVRRTGELIGKKQETILMKQKLKIPWLFIIANLKQRKTSAPGSD